MKKLLLLGAGAQGSTVAKRMNEEPNVAEIVCADYDVAAVKEMERTLQKATALELDATRVENIVRAARGVDLIVNALPIVLSPNALQAALEAEVSYQDFAAAEFENLAFDKGIELLLTEWSDKFEARGLSALMSTGSAPGLANVITRETVEKMDTCDTIQIHVYEGVWAKRFLPFWWSPEVALGDMSCPAYCYEDGRIKETEPFSHEMWMKFRGIDRQIRMVEHAHDEPVTMGLLADKYLKGARNIYFKYGGFGVDFAEPLYRMGLLSSKPVDVKGTTIVPMDLALALTPPAPKYPEEIKAILDEGLEAEEGAFLIRVDGAKDGKPVRIDNYVNAPGVAEAFEKAGLTAETYLTGQCGALFTKMFVNDKIHQKGLFPPEVLDDQQRAYYLREAAKLDITVDRIVEERLQ
ncbi:MAG: saccharopine dehydrogenase NADP-binding domain-containing protein [Deltaproteobacteria bacterium]|nr:saccharopine dehydrogenase NADP-binding domain-containing protein [Deltaproteobacteria bacterium]